MNFYLVFIVVILVIHYLLDLFADILNVCHCSDKLPEEFRDVYDAEKYARSQQYLKDHTRLDTVENSIHTLITLAFILLGGFRLMDLIARGAGWGMIGTGLLFGGILLILSQLVDLPSSIYSTFVLEDKYGFNKTTPKTFILDIVKSLALAVIIGAQVFALVLWFFDAAGEWAWLWCWLAVMLIQALLMYIAPVVIMPLFNKFEPLEDGELKTAIENYAKQQNFKMKGVFKMDGSKRSSKANAFFTGLGKSRRIVLYDTLIAKHSVDELAAIVAHEMGHYKKKHILSAMFRMFLQTAFMFWLLSLFIGNEQLFLAFKMPLPPTVYGSLIFFGFLYTPIGILISIIENAISRRHEYAADRYAAETTGKADAMIAGLKKLSADNLSNLTPHPFMVWLHYSHPPVLERIRALRAG